MRSGYEGNCICRKSTSCCRNTTTLVSQALGGAKDSGASVELVHVPSLISTDAMDVIYCKSHKTCKIDDDMQSPYANIREDDVLIFGIPFYFAQMTCQMKQFVDRFYALIDAEYQPRLTLGKKAAVLLTQGDDNVAAFTVIVDTFNFAMSFLQIPVFEPIIVVGLDAPRDVEMNGSVMDRAYQLGKNRFPCIKSAI
ncbi:MAG TPA: flavodoxin family protein [Methanospirillum sp.]|uniref:flavodoxin family protein n=1 Tax=Methanospirillum sp. TaxID=45200 RepID=UPI002C65843C|nr:flavodoxin family protein [Methanospirillum sp.]HWQ64125.1 flavodoxin family protein [Methanospirillum sp.]